MAEVLDETRTCSCCATSLRADENDVCDYCWSLRTNAD